MAFKMKGMYHGEGTGSALKFFGLLGGKKKEEEPPPPPPSTKVTPKKEDTSDQEDVRESTENASTLASKEYGEQNLAYGQSNPNAQEAEDTIGESARSIIGRSKRFN